MFFGEIILKTSNVLLTENTMTFIKRSAFDPLIWKRKGEDSNNYSLGSSLVKTL